MSPTSTPGCSTPLEQTRGSNHYKCLAAEACGAFLSTVQIIINQKRYYYRMKRLLLLSMLVLAFSSTASAANDTSTEDAILRGDLRSLTIGDEARVTATLVNDLPVQDTIRMTISGSATQGLLDVTVDETPSSITCPGANGLACFVDVDGNGRKDVNLTVEATAMGQGVLKGTANSTTTDLASSDTLDVKIGPQYGRQLVSAPGITAIHILMIAFLAGTVLVFRRE